jgi:prepilin-type N-terminal cleavage/methylation domain-containing protein
MLRQWNVAAGGARRGMTLIELAVSLAALGLLGCLFLASRVPPPMPDGCSAPPAIAIPTPPPPPPPPSNGELSLQETLDRLAFTVNVPQRYRGRQVDSWGYRQSSGDDSVDAGWFRSKGTATFQLISHQSELNASTRFLVQNAEGHALASFDPIDVSGFNGSARLLNWRASQPVRFALDFPSTSYNSGPVFSTQRDNPSGAPQLIVLPARRNGRWVEEGEQLGHWEGGEESGEYLLCWEDVTGSSHGDFQDVAFLARGIVPATPFVGPAE